MIDVKSQPSPDRSNNFNLVRLLGSLGVLFFHVYPAIGLENDPLSFTRWINFGSLSVRVFFVVSGFLLTNSYIRNPDTRSWIVARVLRIWPALIVCTLFTVFVLGPLVTTSPDYWRSAVTYDYLWSAAIFETRSVLPGVFGGIPVPVVNGSLWTLPYESVCYGLLAGAFVLFKDVRVAASLIFSVCAVVILSGNGVQTPIFANVIVLFLCELGPFFFAGVLIRLLNIRGNLYIDFAMCGWMAWALTTVSTDWRPFYEAQIIVIPYLTIRLAYMPFRPFAAVLDRHDISYGMYLYAFPMTQSVVTLIGTGHGVLVTTLISVSATLPLALASWVLIERPALSLRRWLRRPGRDQTIDIPIAGRVKG